MRCLALAMIVATAFAGPRVGEAGAGTSWPELNERGLEAQRAGRYEEAEGLFEQALALAGEDRTSQARTWNNIAAVRYFRGKHAAAEKAYRKALETWRSAPGGSAAEQATCRLNLSILLRQTGQLETAETEASMAIEDMAASGAPGSSLASAYHALAETHRMQGRRTAAEADLRRAEKALGTASSPVLRAHLMLTEASLWQERGKAEFAEPFQRNALGMFVKALGPVHPSTALATGALGQTLMSLGKWRESEEFLHRALQLCEASHGPAHPRTGAAVNNLAQLYLRQNRLADAEPLYRRAIEVLQSSLGPRHPDVARVMANLGDLFFLQGKRRGAEILYRDAIEISESALGSKHPQVGVLLQRLADLLKSQNRATEFRRVRARLDTAFVSGEQQ